MHRVIVKDVELATRLRKKARLKKKFSQSKCIQARNDDDVGSFILRFKREEIKSTGFSSKTPLISCRGDQMVIPMKF